MAADGPGGYSFSGVATVFLVWIPHDPTIPFTGIYTIVTRNESASYEAEVSGPAQSAVPEPGWLGLAAVELLALSTLIRKTTGT